MRSRCLFLFFALYSGGIYSRSFIGYPMSPLNKPSHQYEYDLDVRCTVYQTEQLEKSSHYYVTTPIYYVNGKPHIGSLYSTVLADVAARWHALGGQKTFMLTGTDEHGQKIAEAAAKAGKTPKEFVDSFIPAFKHAWQLYGIHYSEFIRTTDAYHVKAVQQWLLDLQKKGDIYKGSYSGWYCTPCEAFVTEKDMAPEAIALGEKATGVVCPTCGRQTQWLSEECYFFRLSKYQDTLLELYKNNPDFITPKERLHEVIAFVEAGLKDLSISRTTITWGIPFPGDEKHVTYVWADALNNYITAIGYGDESRAQEFAQWWPGVHILGKDIVRFHAVFWPAFLMAAELPLPKKLVVHGWLKIGDQKMSKSLGNVVDPIALHDTYGADEIRYYLTRHMSITHDSPFSIEDLTQRLNSDLAHDLGNLVNRVLALADKYAITQVRPAEKLGEHEAALQAKLIETIIIMRSEMDNYYFHRAYAQLWQCIGATNSYFHGQEPWKVARVDMKRFEDILSATIHAITSIGMLAHPVLPKKMSILLNAFGAKFTYGTDVLRTISCEEWTQLFILNKIEPLFKTYELEKKEEPMDPVKGAPILNTIPFKDFEKVELRVGTITNVETVEKSDKLYKLTVDFGEFGSRTICSGVRHQFKPDELLNKQGVFVFNLEPRAMLGIPSEGMMLFVDTPEGKMHMVTVSGHVTNGMRLK